MTDLTASFWKTMKKAPFHHRGGVAVNILAPAQLLNIRGSSAKVVGTLGKFCIIHLHA